MKTRIRQVKFEFSEQQQQLYDEFSRSLHRHIKMAKSQEYLLTEDFDNALKYYLDNGIELEEALGRLNPEKLGGFYNHPAIG